MLHFAFLYLHAISKLADMDSTSQPIFFLPTCQPRMATLHMIHLMATDRQNTLAVL